MSPYLDVISLLFILSLHRYIVTSPFIDVTSPFIDATSPYCDVMSLYFDVMLPYLDVVSPYLYVMPWIGWVTGVVYETAVSIAFLWKRFSQVTVKLFQQSARVVY